MSDSAGPQRGFFDIWSHVYDLPPVQAAIYHPVHDAVLGELRAHPAPRILDVGSKALGQPARWPTRAEMADRVRAAGFAVDSQKRIFRLGGILIPTVLTVGVKPD